MPAPRIFIDTNVLIYLFSSDTERADRVENILKIGGWISVQALNEMANVARRKLGMSWKEIGEIINSIQQICSVQPLTVETHDVGRGIAERYNVSVYDAMIAAAALICGCHILYSEDMQDGLVIEKQLRISNPFVHQDDIRSPNS